MDKFILNVIHRPELVPEYIDREVQHGKAEQTSKSEVVSESLDIFRLQQEIAHRNNLRTTIQMTFASLYNQEAIELAKEHHETYGDEISLTFLGLNCREFRAMFESKELAIWLFSMEDKMAIVDHLFELFHDVFGFYPTSTGSYYMDAELVNYIKQRYPMVKCAVATCFEEGPTVFHNCNNSWYTLLDGGPWTAWIPSKKHIHCIASGEEDDIGIVAIPHLTRDLLACIDSPGLFFGTHPQNILRGMVYEGFEIPYMYNLVDQYNALKKYNRGFTYNMVYVGPGWMGKSGRWEASHELCVRSYEDFLAYYGELKERGVVEDMTMSAFADWFREHKTYTEPLCALWKDILYGSGSQVFWYADPYFRLCIDMKQGGAIIDLRPYVAKLERPVGVGTECLQDASYPFLVQTRYRAGAFTHYAGEGAIKSCKVKYGQEEVDLSACRTKAVYSEDGSKRILALDPVEIVFGNLTIKLATTYTFPEDTGEIWISRKIVDATDPEAEVIVDEYITSCYGTTEYPEDLTGVKLSVAGKDGTQEALDYGYKCREVYVENAASAEAVVPHVQTKLSMFGEGTTVTGYFREGYAFAPNFTIGIEKTIGNQEELVTCLKVEKAP
jgi:hypothetical protein